MNEYEYNIKVKKGMKRDPEIENMFREQAEGPLREENERAKKKYGADNYAEPRIGARYKEHR